jgi:hypothetical protein
MVANRERCVNTVKQTNVSRFSLCRPFANTQAVVFLLSIAFVFVLMPAPPPARALATAVQLRSYAFFLLPHSLVSFGGTMSSTATSPQPPLTPPAPPALPTTWRTRAATSQCLPYLSSAPCPGPEISESCGRRINTFISKRSLDGKVQQPKIS